MKKLILLFVALATGVFAQTLQIEENFDYPVGDNLTSHGWTNHSGTGTFITIQTGGLTYTNYPSSGIGNSVILNGGGGSREDVNQGIVDTTISTIYYSFLVKVTSASTTADYFIHIGNRAAPNSFSNFSARVFIQDVSGNLRFGISNTTTTTTMGTTNFSYGTTYLVVVKYTINTSGNDECKLWVFSSGVPSDEANAGAPEATNSTTSGQDIIDAIGLRQGSQSYSVQIDGIRVADSWLQAPLPVELTSFTSNILTNGIELKWQTATEVNNYGFEILRSAQNDNINDNWTTLGFVNGNGNSNSPKDYSFVDNDIQNQPNGKYYYRLKQIDTDGSYEYSEEIEVNWTNGITDVNDESNLPKEFSLSQNYPNPFNPSTKIKYAIPSFVETHSNVSQQNGISVKLKIYNVVGQEIATLVNEIKTPGEYEVEFNGKGLSSGMYFYKIEAGNFVQVKKMIMMK